MKRDEKKKEEKIIYITVKLHQLFTDIKKNICSVLHVL